MSDVGSSFDERSLYRPLTTILSVGGTRVKKDTIKFVDSAEC